MKNFPVYDININKLIRGYFTMYFRNRIINKKYLSHIQKRLSLNKVYVSRPEIKHNNTKAIITIYVFDRENLILLKNAKNKKTSLLLSYFRAIIIKLNRFFSLGLKRNISMDNLNTYFSFHINIIKFMFKRELNLIRKHKLKLNINKYKFKDIFLYKLSSIIAKLYKKEVEFNIINLQSIILNSDIFTEILRLKLRKRGKNVVKAMNFILAKVKIPKVNTITERARITKSIDYNLLENKHKNLNLNYIINTKNNLDLTIKGLYKQICYYKKLIFGNSNTKLNNKNIDKNIVFNSIKYKNIGGIRLEIKGRLTRRYRADRAIYKIK
jgi:hypothetical protein